jgi:hypothetical protein
VLVFGIVGDTVSITYEYRDKPFKGNPQFAVEALAYLVECTLTTVSKLAIRKEPPKGELSRQCNIAAVGLHVLVCACAHLEQGLSKTQELAERLRVIPHATPKDAYDCVCRWANNVHEGVENG